MNPDAKVQVRGVQVGKVASIENLPSGGPALHLAMDPSRLSAIPANALVDLASTTVFGAKYVQFLIPDNPSAESLRAGQVVDAQHVMVEVNTVFEELTSVLSKINPAKLNETLGAIASAVNGRGEKIGQITSTCSTYQDCTGRVTSDQSWSGDLVYMSGRWKVSHTVDNWEPCADGTAVPGQQAFTFWKGYPDRSQLLGWDQTTGRTGGCGKNQWLNVTMPFRLTPVG
jgi:Cholesterol uptake porter CUP1 of Mce4, putative/MlaD protein